MKKSTLLIILLFSQELFLFSLSAFSLNTLLSSKSKEILMYSYNHTSIKTRSMCVVGICLLFCGLRYSGNQGKKENKNPYAQEKKYLDITKSIIQIITHRVKNVFLSFNSTKKNIKKLKKITNTLEETTSNTQKKVINIQTSINNIHTQCNSLEQSGKNIISMADNIKKKSKNAENKITKIVDKKVDIHKKSENSISLYNEQTIEPLPNIEPELSAKIANCARNIKQSTEKSNAMVKLNQHTIATLKENSLKIKNMPKKETKYTSYKGEKMRIT